MPVGRPTKYKEEYCDAIVEFMSKGHTAKAWCSEVDIVEDTLYEWVKVHPNFSESLKKARQACQKWYENLFRSAAVGKIENFNATAAIWLSKNVIKWTDKQEISGPGNQPLTLVLKKYDDGDTTSAETD